MQSNVLQGILIPFSDSSFDLVLSLNGFHAFPDKEAAYSEIFRILKPGGIFCGCFYVKGENKHTDWFVEKIYTPKGYFTPPYETAHNLEMKLKPMYRKVRSFINGSRGNIWIF